jgi:hypothetical protein
MAAGAKNKAYAPAVIGFQYVSSVILSEAMDLSPFGRQIMNQIVGCRTPFI